MHTEKIRIAYAGSNTYNQLTSGSWFCNRVTKTDGTNFQRGFLGSALYNENWEPTDGFCFKDFSVEGLVVGDGNSDKTRVQLNEKTLQDKSSLILEGLLQSLFPVLEWNPDFLLLQLNPTLESQPETMPRL